jgi:hypothetical protein
VVEYDMSKHVADTWIWNTFNEVQADMMGIERAKVLTLYYAYTVLRLHCTTLTLYYAHTVLRTHCTTHTLSAFVHLSSTPHAAPSLSLTAGLLDVGEAQLDPWSLLQPGRRG